MQAIVTYYLGPTNHRGGRIVAKCQARSITVSYDHAGNEHLRAAQQLATLLGWNYGRWYAGQLPDGRGNCYVMADEQDSFVVERLPAIFDNGGPTSAAEDRAEGV